MTVRVLIVDDSTLVRQVLTDILSSDPEIEVAGTACDGDHALKKVADLSPDVITLDVEMHRVGGIEFLRRLMQVDPRPVVMVSAYTQAGARATLLALEAGAVDFVPKPESADPKELATVARTLIEKVKLAAQASVMRRPEKQRIDRISMVGSSRQPVAGIAGAPQTQRPVSSDRATLTPRLIAVGASTGGTQTLHGMLSQLPAEMPPVVIVQHMPEAFTGAFAERLDETCALHVALAEDGRKPDPGTAYIAQGGRQLSIRREAGDLIMRVQPGAPVSGHCPSVDVLFDSVAAVCGASAVGVILTGMGEDGARGLKAMHDTGSLTIAQDRATSVVYGMPGAAVRLGAVDLTLGAEEIALYLRGVCRC